MATETSDMQKMMRKSSPMLHHSLCRMPNDWAYVYIFPHRLLSLLNLTVCAEKSKVTAKVVSNTSPRTSSFNESLGSTRMNVLQLSFLQLAINECRGSTTLVQLKTKVRCLPFSIQYCFSAYSSHWIVILWELFVETEQFFRLSVRTAAKCWYIFLETSNYLSSVLNMALPFRVSIFPSRPTPSTTKLPSSLSSVARIYSGSTKYFGGRSPNTNKGAFSGYSSENLVQPPNIVAWESRLISPSKFFPNASANSSCTVRATRRSVDPMGWCCSPITGALYMSPSTSPWNSSSFSPQVNLWHVFLLWHLKPAPPDSTFVHLSLQSTPLQRWHSAPLTHESASFRVTLNLKCCLSTTRGKVQVRSIVEWLVLLRCSSSSKDEPQCTMRQHKLTTIATTADRCNPNISILLQLAAEGEFSCN